MNDKQKRRQKVMTAVREIAGRPKKNRQAQKDEIMANVRERATRGELPKGQISDREMKIFLDMKPKSSNKPKWKDRSGYRAK